MPPFFRYLNPPMISKVHKNNTCAYFFLHNLLLSSFAKLIQRVMFNKYHDCRPKTYFTNTYWTYLLDLRCWICLHVGTYHVCLLGNSFARFYCGLLAKRGTCVALDRPAPSGTWPPRPDHAAVFQN